MRIVCVCKLCTLPALKHDISKQTRHNARLPIPPLLLSFIFSFSLRGGLTQRVGTYVGFIRRAPPGVDPWRYQDIKWQNARAARDPNPGPSHPTCLLLYVCISLSLSIYGYIYIYIYTSISLSLYIYIYIYISYYVGGAAACRARRPSTRAPGIGSAF